MTRSTVWRLAMGAVITACTSASSLAQDAMVAPLPEHENMAREVGVWDADVKMWIDPDSDPQVSKATETVEMLGQMWQVATFEGEIAGMKFKGVGQVGYDPKEKKFVGTWIDTMSPYLGKLEGTYDDENHTLTMMSESRNPMTNEVTTSKNVTKYIDEDTKVFTMYEPAGEEDKWNKVLEVSYKRKK